MAIYNNTKGLLYYLDKIREQVVRGEMLYAALNQNIVNLLLRGLSGIQKKVIQLAACCRGLDKLVIQYLIEQQKL